MADETPSLHIDTDWKKQAQEEKRKLAEAEAAKKAQSTAPAAAPSVPSGAPASAGPAPRGARTAREMPGASFSTLVQSTMTQALYYLGELGGVGGHDEWLRGDEMPPLGRCINCLLTARGRQAAGATRMGRESLL